MSWTLRPFLRYLLRLILSLTFEPVTEVMVKHVIMKYAPKTCSLDPIPTPLLLEILDCLLPSFTALINSSLSSGLFPQVFKSAVSLVAKIETRKR